MKILTCYISRNVRCQVAGLHRVPNEKEKGEPDAEAANARGHCALLGLPQSDARFAGFWLCPTCTYAFKCALYLVSYMHFICCDLTHYFDLFAFFLFQLVICLFHSSLTFPRIRAQYDFHVNRRL
jgi:hypothetical protein